MAAILDFQSARFKLFLIYKSPRCFLASLESSGLSVQEKKQKIDFQDGCHGGHLGFPIGTILVIFDLQVTLMLPTKYRVNWPRGVGRVGFLSNCWRRTTHDGRRTTHDGRRTKDDGHWLTTIAHHEHFVLRWANKKILKGTTLERNEH